METTRSPDINDSTDKGKEKDKGEESTKRRQTNSSHSAHLFERAPADSLRTKTEEYLKGIEDLVSEFLRVHSLPSRCLADPVEAGALIQECQNQIDIHTEKMASIKKEIEKLDSQPQGAEAGNKADTVRTRKPGRGRGKSSRRKSDPTGKNPQSTRTSNSPQSGPKVAERKQHLISSLRPLEKTLQDLKINLVWRQGYQELCKTYETVLNEILGYVEELTGFRFKRFFGLGSSTPVNVVQLDKIRDFLEESFRGPDRAPGSIHDYSNPFDLFPCPFKRPEILKLWSWKVSPDICPSRVVIQELLTVGCESSYDKTAFFRDLSTVASIRTLSVCWSRPAVCMNLDPLDRDQNTTFVSLKREEACEMSLHRKFGAALDIFDVGNLLKRTNGEGKVTTETKEEQAERFLKEKIESRRNARRIFAAKMVSMFVRRLISSPRQLQSNVETKDRNMRESTVLNWVSELVFCPVSPESLHKMRKIASDLSSVDPDLSSSLITELDTWEKTAESQRTPVTPVSDPLQTADTIWGYLNSPECFSDIIRDARERNFEKSEMDDDVRATYECMLHNGLLCELERIKKDSKVHLDTLLSTYSTVEVDPVSLARVKFAINLGLPLIAYDALSPIIDYDPGKAERQSRTQRLETIEGSILALGKNLSNPVTMTQERILNSACSVGFSNNVRDVLCSEYTQRGIDCIADWALCMCQRSPEVMATLMKWSAKHEYDVSLISQSVQSARYHHSVELPFDPKREILYRSAELCIGTYRHKVMSLSKGLQTQSMLDEGEHVPVSSRRAKAKGILAKFPNPFDQDSPEAIKTEIPKLLVTDLEPEPTYGSMFRLDESSLLRSYGYCSNNTYADDSEVLSTRDFVYSYKTKLRLWEECAALTDDMRAMYPLSFEEREEDSLRALKRWDRHVGFWNPWFNSIHAFCIRHACYHPLDPDSGVMELYKCCYDPQPGTNLEDTDATSNTVHYYHCDSRYRDLFLGPEDQRKTLGKPADERSIKGGLDPRDNQKLNQLYRWGFIALRPVSFYHVMETLTERAKVQITGGSYQAETMLFEDKRAFLAREVGALCFRLLPASKAMLQLPSGGSRPAGYLHFTDEELVEMTTKFSEALVSEVPKDGSYDAFLDNLIISVQRMTWFLDNSWLRCLKLYLHNFLGQNAGTQLKETMKATSKIFDAFGDDLAMTSDTYTSKWGANSKKKKETASKEESGDTLNPKVDWLLKNILVEGTEDKILEAWALSWTTSD